ncbi:MAG: hypothetical protein QUS12_02100 [Methanosarcina sp.]|nr:hypothetical protein [Methanosarcina sp.]
MKQRRGYTGYELLHSNPNFKIKYPEFTAYNLEGSTVHNSPCMNPFWKPPEPRQGKSRDEWDFELKHDEED